ncbi:MAG: pyrroline-5-carboxylate reductase family protein [Sphingobium sp.]
MVFPFTPSRPLWLLGCGNMAGAMLSRWLESGLDPAAVTIIDPMRGEAPEGTRLCAAPPAGEPAPAALLVGIKPQIFAEAAGAIDALTGPETVVISIMAGVDGATLGDRFARAGGIVRLMPNLPAALGQGASILHTCRDGADAHGVADALARPLGLALWVDREALIDAGTAVSGSGPAFVYRFIDAIAKGAEKLGFAPDQAAALALATVGGAAALAAASDVSPAALADRVASPGGTTRAGLDILDADRSIDMLVARTLQAASDRAVELAEMARG